MLYRIRHDLVAIPAGCCCIPASCNQYLRAPKDLKQSTCRIADPVQHKYGEIPTVDRSFLTLLACGTLYSSMCANCQQWICAWYISWFTKSFWHGWSQYFTL